MTVLMYSSVVLI